MHKPGPRSKTRKVIVYNRHTLGESTINEDDDSPDGNTSGAHEEDNRSVQQNEKRSTLYTPCENTFLTPERDENATDYGLEFTTSNIQNPSPRRCSTMKTQINIVGREYEEHNAATSIKSSQETNNSPIYVRGSINPEIPEVKSKQLQDQTNASPASKFSAFQKQNTAKKATSTREKKRKQKNPLHMNRQFFREVKLLQNRTDFLVPRLPFSRVIRDIMVDAAQTVTCITPTALDALQTATEMYVSQRIQDAYMLTLHRGRVTLEARDMELMNYLKRQL